MPNWTENSLLVTKKDWEKFKEVALDDNGEVTFKKLIPHPESVKADCFYDNFLTNKPSDVDFDKDLDKYKEVSESFFRNYNGEKVILYNKLKEQAGGDESKLSGWYNWQCENWGTKWDACETCIDNEDEIPELEDTDQIVVMFNTAWSAPEPWFYKLSEVIPFEVECTEEGGFFHWNCESDGEGNFTINDDTEEYFRSQEEDDEE